VITSCDALADMLESIQYFISRLSIYAEMSRSMPGVDEVVAKLMVELFSTLALVTQKLKKRRGREPFLTNMLLLLNARQLNWRRIFSELRISTKHVRGLTIIYKKVSELGLS